MKSYWSAVSRRVAIGREVHRAGGTLLFVHSFFFALALPLLLHLPLPRLQALLDRSARPRRPADRDQIARTVLAMLQAGRPLVRTGCLVRGLTLYYFLRRAGVEVDLCFGMGRVPEGDGFDGHCWLAIEGEPYLEARDPRPLYAGMYAFRGPPPPEPVVRAGAKCPDPR